jgi:hypothetical protein
LELMRLWAEPDAAALLLEALAVAHPSLGV